MKAGALPYPDSWRNDTTGDIPFPDHGILQDFHDDPWCSLQPVAALLSDLALVCIYLLSPCKLMAAASSPSQTEYLPSSFGYSSRGWL
jgi:hypothetical protein